MQHVKAVTALGLILTTHTDELLTTRSVSVGIRIRRSFPGKKAKALLDSGWDPTPAYLKLLLDNVGPGKPFGKLTNAKLREFGAKLSFLLLARAIH